MGKTATDWNFCSCLWNLLLGRTEPPRSDYLISSHPNVAYPESGMRTSLGPLPCFISLLVVALGVLDVVHLTELDAVPILISANHLLVLETMAGDAPQPSAGDLAGTSTSSSARHFVTLT